VEFLKNPMFWLSVIIVAIVVNFFWAKFARGDGKLV
jgi:hypothetical protein